MKSAIPFLRSWHFVTSACLVTGASGFLGANFALELPPHLSLLGISRKRPDSTFYRRWRSLDLRNHSEVQQLMSRVRPAVVIHTAALSSHDACEAEPALAHELNVQVTRTIAASANEVGAQFVYISTDAVFGGDNAPYSPEAEPSPFSIYGETKLKGEIAALEVTDALVIRTSFFGWSPSGDRSILEFFHSNLLRGKDIPGFINVVSNSIYAEQLRDIAWRLIDRKTTGIVHVAASNSLSKLRFGQRVAQTFDLSQSLIYPIAVPERDLTLVVSQTERMIADLMPSQENGLLMARQRRYLFEQGYQSNPR